MAIRVLVADDQAMVRAGFRMLLSREPGIEVVGEAADGVEAVRLVGACRPTVVLMDIRMPRLDGLAATRQILTGDEPPRVLVLTTFDLDEYVFEALNAGAAGSCSRTTRRRSWWTPSDRGRGRGAAVTGRDPARDRPVHPAGAADTARGTGHAH